MKITCIGLDNCLPLKTLSLRQRQIDQHKALAPIKIIFFMGLDTPLSQLPKILVALRGGGILEVKNTHLQMKPHRILLRILTLEFIVAIYIDLTENWPSL